MFPFGGLVRFRVPPAVQAGCGEGPQRPIRRWSMSLAWVVEPERTRTAELIGDAAV